MRPTSVLATVTGRDRPGVTAAFFAALAAHDVDVCDVEQVVIRERLVLSVLLDLRGDPGALRSSAMSTAHALGMECEVTIADEAPNGHAVAEGPRTHVIVIGRPLRPGAVSHVAQRIADLGANIESISRLSAEPVASLELLVRAPDPARLRAALVQASEDTGVDIAVEPAGHQRRAKRLIALDVDSTLVQDEALDMLAERAGVHGEVAQITARAISGELDFAASLRARVQLLTGLPVSEVDRVRDELRLTPGADTFVRTLRWLGYRVGVLSGGFTVFLDRIAAELELDFAAANELEIVDGVVTGRLTGPLLDGAGKAAALTRFADQFGVALSQTVAVADDANDIDILEAAGLGIAFNAKAALRAAADASVTLPYLDTVLFVLGVSDADVAAAARA
jgi:phosphoserine phosphatase